METNEMILQVILFLKENKKREFTSYIEELQPYDLGHIYQELPIKHKKRFLEFLGRELNVILIQELSNEHRIDMIERIPPKTLTYILDKMDNDDLTVLLDGLPEERVNELLHKMDDEESEVVQNMLAYDVETAGRMMTNRFIWVMKDDTVIEAVSKMKTYAQFSETINYLYVVDEEKKLSGVVSHRELILAEPHEKIGDIMFNRVIAVQTDTDQEEVARLIEKYDFLAVPVVEEDNRLAGIITIDDAIDIVIKEANEDIEKLSASGKDIDFHTKATLATIKRLPWLILLLFIGLFSGNIISQFENTLKQVVALTYFMPMIAGMTGNTGTQSLAVTVRGLANHELNRKTIQKLIFRELRVGIMIGIVCGIMIALIAYFWQGNEVLGLVVGGSLLATLIIGTMAGTVIPIILYKLKIDPAIASGPLITTLNDIFSLLVYFGMATLFLKYII